MGCDGEKTRPTENGPSAENGRADGASVAPLASQRPF
jgi:hypothetical protein